MKRVRKRLTYANVMSSIAVFLVVAGGSAVAASQLGKNTVGAKQLKANAVTAAKIKNGAVSGAKLNLKTLGTVPSATTATTANSAKSAETAKSADTAKSAETAKSADTAKTATTANSATTAGKANEATTAANLQGFYRAVVNADGTLFKGSAGISSESAGGGAYRVITPEPTANCVAVAGPGGNKPGEPQSGQVSANTSSTNPNAFYVTTFNGAGTETAQPFSILVDCTG